MERLEAPLTRANAGHPPRLHGFDDALESVLSKVGVFECTSSQPMGAGANHDLIRPGQSLQPCGAIRGFTHSGLGHGGIAGTGLAHHHRAGGNADAHSQRRWRLDVLDRVDDFEPGPDCSFGIVLVRARPTEVDHEPVAQILGYVAVVSLDDGGARLLVGVHQLSQLFRVELLGQ